MWQFFPVQSSSYPGRLLPQWELEATRLYEAKKGLGTDEDTITGVLARFRNRERQKLLKVYKEKYDEVIVDFLKVD